MIRLSDEEKQLIVIIQRAIVANLTPDIETFDSIAEAKLGRQKLDWDNAYKCLQEKSLIISDNSRYKFTEKGEALAKLVQRERPIHMYWYNEYYLRAEQSRVHGEFCERVYGRDYCQHGIADMSQVDKLLDMLKLKNGDKVLELGCGNGMITEYLADRSGANMLGVDIADRAIESANMRTAEKRDRVSFEVQNMYDLNYPEDIFDCVIAIDTLYFVMDLDELISRLTKILKPGGRMGIFYGTYILGSETILSNSPDKNKLGLALTKHGLKFETRDLTKDDLDHWQHKKKVLDELKPRFESENNMFLFDNRIAECESLPLGEPGRRFLYLVINK